MSIERILPDLREEYTGDILREDSVQPSPFDQFRLWFDDAVAAEVPMPDGMTLATTDGAGQPSARIVLLRACDDRGLVFFTNYQSRKGRELEQSRYRAALLFWWQPLQRQVRVEGTIEKVSAAESDAYFASRPHASNLTAIASPQSQVVPGRQWLEERVARTREEWAGRDLVRTEGWGGFRLRPRAFEFWQGQPSRLHDRLRYRLSEDGHWLVERLAP